MKKKVKVRKHKRRTKKGSTIIKKHYRKLKQERSPKKFLKDLTLEEKALLSEVLTKRAKDIFGTTDDPFSAFYLLNDGEFLKGLPLYHSNIYEVTEGFKDIHPLNKLFPDDPRLEDDRQIFQSFANAIHFGAARKLPPDSGEIIEIELSIDQEPTNKQWKTLLDIFYILENPEVLYDISQTTGELIISGSFDESIRPKQIISKLKKLMTEKKKTNKK